MMSLLIVILVAFDKFKREADGQEIKIIFDLLEDIAFGAYGFAGSEILSILMKTKFLE